MKPKTFKPRYSLYLKLFLLLVLFVCKTKGTNTSIRQDSFFNASFVIIGTYVEESNALKHVSQARLYIKSAGYFFNDIKNSYYVFAYKSDNKRATLNKLHELRSNPYFRNAWYYKHQSEKKVAKTNLKGNFNLKTTRPPVKESTFAKGPSSKPVIPRNRPEADEKNSKILEKRRPTVDAKEPFQGQEKNNLVADSRSHVIPTVTTSLAGQSAIEQLQTAKSGDIIIFNNLLFHRNAAILQRSSELDLNKLLSIMLDNARMKIRIHGHTNGDFRGEIVTLGKKNKNYFQTSSKNDYVQGDAVLLSVERAKIISRYLKEKGILPERIEIKGWGSQKTIYSLSSSESRLNSRVEIEILEK